MTNIVVGSGVAGLTLALLLAKRGEEVTIVEAQKQAAPLMNGFSRKGLFFDTGFHYAGAMHKTGVLYKWLNALGVWQHLEEKKTYFVQEEFRFKRKSLYFPSHFKSLQTSIIEQFCLQNNNLSFSKLAQDISAQQDLPERFEIFLKKMQDVIEKSPFMNELQHNMPSQDIFQSETLLDVIKPLQFPSYLEKMLFARCLLLGIEPSKMAFKDYAVLSMPYFESASTVQGGGKAIRNAFLAELANYNVKIKCNTRMTKFLQEDKKVLAIEIDNKEQIPCKRCFYTGHPKNISLMSPTSTFRPAYLNRLSSLEETPSAFIVYAETQSSYLAHKVTYLLDEEEENFFNAAEKPNPVIYISCGEAVDGRYPLTIITTVEIDIDKSSLDYQNFKKRLSEKVLAYVKKRIPELDDLNLVDVSTPSTFRDWIYGSTGSLYGIRHDYDTLALLPITRIEGFYLAGQNILLPGLLGSLVSSVVCASLIFGENTILEGFRSWKENV